MKSLARPLAAALGIAAAGAVLTPTAAFAAPTATCGGYSHTCPNVEGHKIVRPPEVQGERETLPFTGGEIVLMTVAGAGALGAGGAFVIAGRRRRSTPA